MNTTVYSDLYEDEIAAVLRSLPHNVIIEAEGGYSYRPANMIVEDGIYTSGEGLYTVYHYGVGAGQHVGVRYLTDALSHTTFFVKEV